MTRRARRSLRVPIVGALTVAACAGSGPDAAAAREQGDSAFDHARATTVAARLVVAGRGVRWISARELCVTPFDAPDFDACARRPAPSLAPQLRASLARELAPDPGTPSAIACLRVSRVLDFGDSALVVIGLVGAAEADGLAEARTRLVWLRAGARRGSYRALAAADPGDAIASDVRPVRGADSC